MRCEHVRVPEHRKVYIENLLNVISFGYIGFKNQCNWNYIDFQRNFNSNCSIKLIIIILFIHSLLRKTVYSFRRMPLSRKNTELKLNKVILCTISPSWCNVRREDLCASDFSAVTDRSDCRRPIALRR